MTTEYIKQACEVIDTEIEGLKAVKDSFGEVFEKIIDLILTSKGKVIISGMGKSGHIANKIAATLASTGTPSFAIHPGEASHGDLGMISKDDVVILLSNSGETKELGDIINYCKRFSIPLVGMVRRKTSLLVDAADIAVILPEIDEASDVDAPTTSTTMMLAYGDAIAVVLAKVKGFTKDDFGVFHPGGKIGSQFIKTEKIMRSGDSIPVVTEDASMQNTLKEISDKAMGFVAIVSSDNKLVGIITDGDLRRQMDKGISDKVAADFMTRNPKSVAKNTLALEAVSIMQEKKILSVLVTEGDKLVGAVHIHDCFKAGLI